MLTVGLTGPTGAGKTTVLGILADLGFVCVDCDRLYHHLLDTSPALLSELTDRFGKSILDNQGKVDRKALAAVVFADAAALADLNAITHRYVLSACRRQADQARLQGKRGVVFDAVALVESGLGQMCDVTVAVVAPDPLRLARIMVRDGLDAADAKRRMDAQKPNEYYVNHCDRTIVNDGTKSQEELSREVRRMVEQELC